ncbi:acetate--CoA ligase family protein [Thauera sp. SDU_THAU2]|uniref:acetate--CoA ligase family protein n=1 Tax=Thauera sp. SDU_THAU2 TaxID=3136633 RepID=UPI00311DBD72
MRLLAALGERGIYLARRKQLGPVAAAEPDAAVLAAFATACKQGRDLLEYEARALLRAHGVAVAEERVAHGADELAGIAAHFGEQALAMKVVSRDILHKSDAGGVKLDLRGEAELRTAYDAIMSSCRAYAPQADIEGMLLTPMARKGVEIIIGVSRDPIFGPVVMFGLGGIFVEVLEDVAFRSIPLSRHDARSMVNQIKARRILDGVRGHVPVDTEALADLLLKVSGIVSAYPQIAELDLNPVMAYEDGYAVVDARVIVGEAGRA